MRVRKWLGQLNKILVPFVFLLILAGGGLWQLFQKDHVYSASERRLLEQMPKVSVNTIMDASFMNAYETYLTDQFPMRDEWITLKAYCGLLLGQRETGGVYIAKDHSLIELHRETDIDVKWYETNTEAVVQFASYAAKQCGAGHVRLMLVPTAEEVWSEKLQEHLRLFDQTAYVEIIKELLMQKELQYEQMVVDVENVLNLHEDEAIYYKTDHHWTALGAYYGYVAYMESLTYGEQADDDKVITVRPYSYYEVRTVNDSFCGTTGAKCGMYQIKDRIELVYPVEPELYLVDHNMGLSVTDSLYDIEKANGDDPYAVYLGGNDAIVTVTTTKENEEREADQSGSGVHAEEDRHLLVVRDSYANCFIPYLTSDFAKITMIDPRYYNGSIQTLLSEGSYTDVLVLYNIPNLIMDRSVYKLTR